MNKHVPWVDIDQQAALGRWALVESISKPVTPIFCKFTPLGKNRNEANRSRFALKDQDSSVNPPQFRVSRLRLLFGFIC